MGRTIIKESESGMDSKMIFNSSLHEEASECLSRTKRRLQKTVDRRFRSIDGMRQGKNPRRFGTNGWNNMIALIALIGVVRFVLTNILELGWLVEIPLSSYTLEDYAGVAIVFGLNVLRSMTCFCISGSKLVLIAYVLVTEALLSWFIFSNVENRNMSALSYVMSIIFDMKLISFIGEADGREIRKFWEFLVFPTLIYKESYNRKAKRSFVTLGKTCAKLFLSYILLCFFIDQHAVPAFYRLMMFRDFCSLLESFLNFSLASIILFNIFFKMAFDYGITVFSEITRFDEKIYGEWWNSKSSEEFWKSWNLPVHIFMKRHVYLPLVGAGFKKHTSSLICFALSGAVHEYIVSMSLRSFNGWFFMAMMAQIPLHFITDFVKRRFPSIANTFFWVSFCVIGQPITILLMYRTLYTRNEIATYLNSLCKHNEKLIWEISKQ